MNTTINNVIIAYITRIIFPILILALVKKDINQKKL